MLTIESKNGWFHATVADGPAGVAVEVWRKTARGGGPVARMHREVVDATFHWVCDRTVALVDQLQPEFDKPSTARVFADLLVTEA